MNWLYQLAIAAILLSLFYILLPEGEMKRIAGIVFSVIFLLQTVLPFISLRMEDLSDWLSGWQLKMAVSGEEDPALLQSILADYQGKCEKEIGDFIQEQADVASGRATVVIDSDPQSETFGALQHIYAYVHFQDETVQETDSWIQPIVIAPIGESSGTSSADVQKQCAEIRAALALWLQVDIACVTIFEEGM